VSNENYMNKMNNESGIVSRLPWHIIRYYVSRNPSEY
jgi:hypothetical protein